MTTCQTPDCNREAQTARGRKDVCFHCAVDIDYERADKAPVELDQYDREEK
jgi:hypothetical protein